MCLQGLLVLLLGIISLHCAKSHPSSGADAYLYFNGALARGSDLSVGENTYLEARDICMNNEDCMGFTFKNPDKTPSERQKVYFKSGIAFNDDPNWNAYVKRPGAGNCTAVDGMDFSSGWVKTKFQQTTVDQCCSFCSAFRTACQAWIWDKVDRSCTIDNWFGETRAGIKEDSGKISGWGPGTDCVTVGIQQCNANEGCLAFSMGTADGKKYELELYTCTSGQSYNSGWTVYRKKDNFAIPFDNTKGDQNACSQTPLPMMRFTCSQSLVNDGQVVTLARCDPAKSRQKWSVDVPSNTMVSKAAGATETSSDNTIVSSSSKAARRPMADEEDRRADSAAHQRRLFEERNESVQTPVGAGAASMRARPPCDIGGAWAASGGGTYEIEMTGPSSFRMLSLSPTSWLTAVGIYTLDSVSGQPMAAVSFDDGRTDVGVSGLQVQPLYTVQNVLDPYNV
jgi:hypothetical protein